jgi:pectinesterase inhibitor-like protein
MPAVPPSWARHCAGTLHRDVCASTLASIPNLAQKPLQDVISEVVGRAAAAVRASSSNCSTYMRRPRGLRVRDRLALSDCVELFGGTPRLLGAAAAELSAVGNARTAGESVAGVRTALSAALTNQYTCLDGFAGPSASEDGRVRPFVQGRIYHVAHLVSKDGSGDLTTVSEAVAAAPNNSDARYVIYIKAGGYLENVEVGSHKTNLMFVGDGMWKTVIKASRNFVDNSTTFRSATLGAFSPATNLSHRCTACTTLFFAPLLLDLTVAGTGRVNKICSGGGHGFPDGGERGGSEQSQAADHDTSIRCAVEIEFIINSNLLLILKKLSSGPRHLYVASHLA